MRMVLKRILSRNPLNPVLFLLAMAALLLLGAPVGPTGGVVERRAHVMGTSLAVRVEGAGPEAASAAAEAALATVERFDRLLSTWDPATPVSVANRAPVGEATFVPPEVARLLGEAEAWAHRTGRAFDPTVGALVDAWGLRAEGRTPSDEELRAARTRVGPAALSVDPIAGTVTRRWEGAWLDTGGFGKGAALRAAADTLRARGVRRALLDLGGQVLALAAPGEEPWDVAVAHPAWRQQPAALLRLAGVSAATSGNSERGLVADGSRLGHILDPRSGVPAPWWGSVTVVSADPLEADVLSTALYVMGPEAGMTRARDLHGVGVLFLVEDGTALRSLHNRAMQTWLVEPPAQAGSPIPPTPERRFP